ncbi:MAG TPA: chorismate mutase [Miltoncostaeaceae bacterium]|jgi:chorismate mutase|nr:chorismate mutase [Miltoncostaeaceae bacterium]
MSEPPATLRGLRGAITVDADDAGAIRAATTEMLTAILERNGLGDDGLVSMLFTLTPDLRAEFPAVAAREMGLSHVPLLCATEIAVPGAIPRCIRVLVHCYMPGDRAPRHVYLREARALRSDLAD